MNQQEASTNLDQDLLNSRFVKYKTHEHETKQWILRTLDKPDQNEDLLDLLKDGIILCELANKIRPTKFKQSKFPFVQMENISNFLQTCSSLGMPQDELFQTIDLYEKKDPYQVIITLQSFSRKSGLKDIIGPQISEKRKPVKPTKPAKLYGWSTLEYGYMGGANQSTEGVVIGGTKEIKRGN